MYVAVEKMVGSQFQVAKDRGTGPFGITGGRS